MNIFDIYQDYEQKYFNWLGDKTNKSWYHPEQIKKSYYKTGIDEGLLSTKQSLFGEEGKYQYGQPPIHKGADKQGWITAGGQKPTISSIQEGKLADKAKMLYAGGKKDYLGEPIGFGEGKVDPGLAAGQKKTEGSFMNLITPSDRIGGKIKKKAIHAWNNLVKDNLQKFAVRNANGDIMKDEHGAVILNEEGKQKVANAKHEMDLKKGGKNQKDDQFLPDDKKHTDTDLKGLAKFAGVSFSDMQKNWEKKGGMDGLMANPAFTLGLALMQSSAQGKTIGSSVMDNFIKASGMSEHYKDRLKDRRNILGPVSDAQRAQVTSALPINIGSPGWLTSTLGDGDELRSHNAALNMIHENVYSKMGSEKDWDYSKGTKRLKQSTIISEFNKLKANGSIMVHQGQGGSYLSVKGMKSGSREYEGSATAVVQNTIDSIGDFFKTQTKKIKKWANTAPARAAGGPVQAGKPYVVGEKGPEIVIPNQNATVLSNDDSQVMSMLLQANPQLQGVSRNRAESILKSRFPDYFV
jgi:hypothetical protein